ncbi:short-chain dehydrogenase/reductase family 42E member 1-like [Chenopodium quinoa]|uniref:short-chain dehydrogenase/reductase family 42E member 1-like n=1 Tax=Chenopodium quinoa TaxID=63459 RepID=UPI000B77F9F4|nr:short-chain dehydrogenase/reductase family 42E member 1-like [Chenopodium quinoa]
MVKKEGNEGIEGKTIVVTGGLGFLGASLCLKLVQKGAFEVRSLDVRISSPWSSLLSQAGVVSILGDITCKKEVEKALQGADCVFHIASYGMSGKEMLRTAQINKVNIDGTRIILDVCLKFGIKRLVYLSTCNVVFGGKEIVNGDENLPYLPLGDYCDPYSRSKAIAEQLVLKYNGRPFRDNGGNFYSCAVRPASIYGPGEDNIFPRIVNCAKLGMLLFKIGNASVKTDWVYVDNLVSGLLLASIGLLDEVSGRERHPIAAGQSYVISDGSPSNTFEFIRPLLESLEYGVPNASLTVPSALVFGKICQVFYTILYPLLSISWLPQPLILPAEVYQIGVSHYFSLQKAEEELGYFPVVSPQEGMETMISYWRERKRRNIDSPKLYAWLFCVFGLSGLFIVNFLPDIGPVTLLRAIALLIFRSMRKIRIVSCIVATAHISEAIFAWFLAKKVDPANARGWFWQTLLLATFSLRLLLARAGPLS